MNPRRLSLLWKTWLSTSVVLSVLFAAVGWVLQRHALRATLRSLEDEVRASFQAYESVWRARAEMLGSVASILSSLPTVRAAFGTRDVATIRDAAGELWPRISDRLKETAFFLVSDPEGRVVASLDNATPAHTPAQWPVVRRIRARFPAQVSGFFVHEKQLFQLVLTPVYVDSGAGPALINVLVAGYTVNHLVAQRLKDSTGGSEFLFLSPGQVFASTLNDRATAQLARNARGGPVPGLVSDGVSEYATLLRDLIDVEGKPVGRLAIFRSFEAARQRVAELRRDVILIWIFAMSLGLTLTYAATRRIIRPVENLDRAAVEVARQNYSFRVPVESEDELGRLASTFNTMCASLESARRELIRQERISTVGWLASSIVHDLRNPLAAIYGGAEMMADGRLPLPQVERLAGNIFRASRRIQEMLDDLVNITRGGVRAPELCSLREVIEAAVEAERQAAESQSVEIDVAAPDDLEVPLERARIERVFVNLMANALDAMPGGGHIRIAARRTENAALVEVEDTGPGIASEMRDRLFQPFATHGKKGGLGLGLALARQAALDHGGDLWVADSSGQGALFVLRLPLDAAARPVSPVV